MVGPLGLPGGPAVSGPPALVGLSVFERTFPARIAVLMRSRPDHRGDRGREPAGLAAATYDIATFALAAIDLVVAQQGFEEEPTYDDVVNGLTTLAWRTAPQRPAAHRAVCQHADPIRCATCRTPGLVLPGREPARGSMAATSENATAFPCCRSQ